MLSTEPSRPAAGRAGELTSSLDHEAGSGLNLAEPDQGWLTRVNARRLALLQVLAESGRPVAQEDLKAEVARRVPLAPYDTTLDAGGNERWWLRLRWNLAGMQTNGWLHRVDGRVAITREGREALAQHDSPVAIGEAEDARYRAWTATRDEVLPDHPADPATAVVHPGSAAAHIFRGAGAVLTAWRTGGSAVDPGRMVWTAAVAERLAECLDRAEDQGLADADDDVRLLAAEGLALVLGGFSDLRGIETRYVVRDCLMDMGVGDLPALPLPLSADLDHGFLRGGAGLYRQRWRVLHAFADVLRHWWAASPEDRQRAWEDPWAFRDLVGSGPAPEDDLVVGLLCVLAHPDAFTTLVRRADREQAVAALSPHYLAEPSGDVERDLRDVVLALQREQGGHAVELLDPPLVQRWRTEEEGARAWLVRGEVDQQNRVRSWRQQGLVTLTAGRLTALPDDLHQGALARLVDERYVDLPVVKREAKRRDVAAFVLAMDAGDTVATVDGDVLRLGRLAAGEASLDSIGGATVLRRPADWVDLAVEVASLDAALRKRLRFPGTDVVDLTEVVADLEALRGEDGPGLDEDEVEPDDAAVDADPAEDDVAEPSEGPLPRAVLQCDTAALARELHHADSSWLDELLASLDERRQVVLEGPPGTGKTHLVRRLLEACGLPEAQQALVQFHPTYSYEDFVEGYRPVPGGEEAGSARLAVVPGPLRRIADEARNAPGKPFVLVVDEINRANIAKVFGELYFLLEYRDADIELLYGGASERFSLPDNLFLIGTMNTADRSIALLDAAMRRRFVFLSMDDSEPALRGVLARWAAAEGHAPALAVLLDRLNERMVAHGLDPSLAFGPSYFMRERASEPATLDRLWRRELLPLLREHHYGEHDRLQEWYPFTRWMAELGLTGAPVPDAADAAPAADAAADADVVAGDEPG